MRTTVDIDVHLMRSLRERAFRTGRSFKETLNEAIAAGVSGTTEPGREVILPSWEMGSPLHPLDRAWQIVAELEAAAALAVENDAVIATRDADFSRFTGLRTLKPF